MKSVEFVHLHCHSDYSLLDGCARFANERGEATPMMQKLAQWGIKHHALTDHGNIFGAIEFYRACQSVGINPVIGCELYIARGSRFDKKSPTKDEENPQKTGINHLTVLAQNNEGYQNLIELATKASLEGFYYKPRADKELLKAHCKGLIALSGCLKGEVAQAILANNMELATQRAKDIEEVFGRGNFYLEVMDHGLEAQKRVNEALFEISKKTDTPVVATNDCHYFSKEDAAAHDAMLCIGSGKKIEDAKRLRFATNEFYYKKPQEMESLFPLHPEALKNTLTVAERCRVQISFDEFHLPNYTVPEGYTQESFLEKLCHEGLKKKFSAGAPHLYQKRLALELAVIKKMGFPGYFLIVWDFINFARKNNVPVGPGRGSGAGSLVSYLLNITNVDPIDHRLLFERFLNPDRRSMPDLDIDFSDEGRELVINYVREKYGFSNVAPIITFGTLQSRLVVRDVGRVLNVPLPEVDKITKAIPPGMTIEAALAKSQDLARLYDENDAVKKILKLATRLEGCRRHTGIHAAGIVITKEPVTKYAPLYKNPTSHVVSTGFNDESLIKLGLLKVDFLGLRTLTVIQKTLELISSVRGITIDIDKIPYDDKKAFELLGRSQTGGVFQLESRGMRELLARLKPSSLNEIIALIALFRPGPMKWIDEYVRRKHNPSLVKFQHPSLELILKETYGICLYQEQVMEISKRLAAFTGGEADRLRKAMGKKIPKELDKLEEKFIDGCKRNSIPAPFAKKLYEDLKDFGHYAFNKSHSAAYGIVAYQTAYLKANYPLEFMAALASSEIGRTVVGSEDKENKIATYLAEAKTMGFEILAPSINKSQKKFSIEEHRIRFALLAIRNVGEAAVEELLAKRNKGGDFKNLKDFFERIDHQTINRKVLESLAKSGALGCVLEGASPSESRQLFIQNIDMYLKTWVREEGEMLFDLEPPVDTRHKTPQQKEDTLQWEKDTLGIYISEHPLSQWNRLLKASPFLSIQELKKTRPNTRVVVAALAVNIRRQISKKTGQAWARLKLEDLSGEIEAVLFPKAFANTKPKALKSGSILIGFGRISLREALDDSTGGSGTQEEFLLDELLALEDFLDTECSGLEIAVDPHNKAALEEIQKALAIAEAGKITISLAVNGHRIVLPQKIRLPKDLSLFLSNLGDRLSFSVQEAKSYIR